jgi:replicative DNA helicase
MIQTELNVIATALQNSECLTQIIELETGHFYNPDCKLIYDTIAELYDENINADLPAIIARIEENGKHLNDDIILSLSVIQPSYNFNVIIASLIKRFNEQKRKDLAKDLYKAKDELEIENLLKEFEQINNTAKETTTTKELASKDIDSLFSKVYFVQTGIDALDELLIGMFDGQLITIAGRPGQGKTTLALQIALNIKYPTLFLSGEMDRLELYAKMLTNRAEVQTWKIEAKKMLEHEMKLVFDAHEYYKNNKKMTFFDGKLSLRKAKNIIKKEAKRHRIVIIDYLQIMSGGQGSSEHLRISEITRELKGLAREIKKPILLLSQMTRDIEKAKRDPVLSDLRESGAIEADSDVVLFVHDGNIIIGKNRKGKIGKIEEVKFIKEYSRWVSL